VQARVILKSIARNKLSLRAKRGNLASPTPEKRTQRKGLPVIPAVVGGNPRSTFAVGNRTDSRHALRMGVKGWVIAQS
jgi:hypothetical protein